MKALVIPASTAATMSSREIADLVEARHNDVVSTIERLFDKGLLRSSRKTRREATRGRPIDVYDLVERDTHLVVAGYSDEHRARVIDRWQELEAQAAPGFAIPTTLSGALMLAAEQAATIERQQAQIADAAPKVEFVDRYVDATGNKGFRQVAKLLKANEARFREFLEAKNIMYRLGGEWTPYQNHIDAGRFVVKTGVSESDHAYTQPKFTPKGIEWIAALWAVHCLREDEDREAA
ncbi:phage antirepressor KilAC domain-containing protein [Achromobacter sp. UBA2119]|uniref:phage antirepressor KilAC domain-containing protein n=1 Tax=Achromobacter sp. UBA2119 TaxID=1945911 RepID=UPI0025805CA1|nr:phage antirepressor KilAC domain-containing protein [Achromobacter sp. UBA2119]